LGLTGNNINEQGSFAADNTGRVCRGIELDPLYVDVIIRRYEAATGNATVLLETGETFEALAVRRSREAPV
jgi:DNA modification methylase